ncbi:MAG: hypothetical protein HYX37_21290 [Rhizobiales bacterium]|nr:hypothetical protein [Hyphomicrobiales bacterium]
MPAAAVAGKSRPFARIAARLNHRRYRSAVKSDARVRISQRICVPYWGMLDPNQGRARTGHGLFELTFKKFECDFVRRIEEEERS